MLNIMKRRFVLLLALLLLLSGLGVGVHLWKQRGVFIIGDPSWPGMQLGSLTRIELKTTEGSYSFSPDHDAWYADPGNGGPRVLASTERLQALLDTIGQKPPIAHVARFSRREKSQYGLDNDTISLTLHGKTVWGIVLGSQTGDNATMYARSSLQGDQIVQVDKRYTEFFNRPVDYFYDLKLTSAAQPEAIEQVSAEGPGVGVWQITRKGDGFVFSAPDQQMRHLVAQAKAELYLHTLANARARGVMPSGMEKLPPPQLKLAIWRKGASDPETVAFYHNGNDGKTFLAISSRQQSTLVVEAGLEEKLAVSAFALREKPVLEVDLGQVESQRFTQHRDGAARSFSVVRSANGWQEASARSDVTGLDVIMWRLGSLQFVDTPRSSAPEGARLLLTWELFGQGQTPLATIFFHTDPLSAGRCWARVQGEDIWFPVDKLLLNDLTSRLPAM